MLSAEKRKAEKLYFLFFGDQERRLAQMQATSSTNAEKRERN
jgi:hypothetical protein